MDNTFTTYTLLQDFLKKTTDLTRIYNYLKDVVSEEASILFKKDKKENKETADKKQCVKDAEDHYLEEINHFLVNTNVQPTAMTIMGYRRKPHAWAIAHAITEYRTTNEQ